MKSVGSNPGALSGAELTLVIPELGRPLPSMLRLPLLERLLARGEPLPPPPAGWEALLGALFGLPTAPPVAALCRLADGGLPDEQCWLRLDPVHLTVDRDRVYLTHHPLSLRPDEAQALVAELNRYLMEEGVSIEWLHPERWYLAVPPAEAAPQSVPPPEALGRDIHDLLPGGAGGRLWRARLTALEMLLHQSEVNRAREGSGQVPVNSLWLWGAGALPKGLGRRWDGVYGGDCLARGLARASLTPWRPLSDVAAIGGDEGAGRRLLLVFSARPGRPLEEQLRGVEQHWLEPLVEGVRGGALASLTLYGTHGVAFTAGRRELRRWWRRSRPLARRFGGAS